MNARTTSRIPICLFVDVASKLECDVSVENPLAARNTALLHTYAAYCDPRLRPLAYAIKRWARARRLNSPGDGTLSSYGYLLLLIHFLQVRARVSLPRRPV